MKKSLLVFVAFLVLSPSALACLCPPNMASWLRQADKVLVVRIDSVIPGREDAISGSSCATDQPPCFGLQVAETTTVYSIKGNGGALHRISSGYGGGDCGIALIAGGYYVIFMSGDGHRVGSCNSAGPYIQLPLDFGPYPKQIGHFVGSLQTALRDPKAPIPSVPAPQQLGASSLR
jgi:hypothetical protein